MAKYLVTYEHEVVITYEAYVDADSIEDAKQKIHDGNIEEEHENDYQGMEIRIKDITLEDDLELEEE